MKHHHACVRVQNSKDNTRTIATVSVYHKYNHDRERQTWKGFLKPGSSTEPTLEVSYETGFGGTSKDWWYVTWQYQGQGGIAL
ncbi:hypothetical protein [Thaumasiovibrio subtropicus]|uniref:hypothetical protein n=1 Tax=Thaumasiovibrio subtropicus TaxID=1891207 RepID=UPI000B35F94B|nr:hypothetical protein [Thaumasiovibrio subtropicus]